MTNYLKREVLMLNKYLTAQMNNASEHEGNVFFNYLATVSALVAEIKKLEQDYSMAQSAIKLLNSRVNELSQENLQPLVDEAIKKYKNHLHYFIDNDYDEWED